MPNGMYGGVRGRRKSALLDFAVYTNPSALVYPPDPLPHMLDKKGWGGVILGTA